MVFLPSLIGRREIKAEKVNDHKVLLSEGNV